MVHFSNIAAPSSFIEVIFEKNGASGPPSTKDQRDWSLNDGFTHIYSIITSDVTCLTCEKLIMAHTDSERIAWKGN